MCQVLRFASVVLISVVLPACGSPTRSHADHGIAGLAQEGSATEATRLILQDLRLIVSAVLQVRHEHPRPYRPVTRLTIRVDSTAKGIDPKAVTRTALDEITTWHEVSADVEVEEVDEGRQRGGLPTITVAWSRGVYGLRVVAAYHLGGADGVAIGDPFIWVDRLAMPTTSGRFNLEPPWGGFGYGSIYPVGVEGVYSSGFVPFPRDRYPGESSQRGGR